MCANDRCVWLMVSSHMPLLDTFMLFVRGCIHFFFSCHFGIPSLGLRLLAVKSPALRACSGLEEGSELTIEGFSVVC